MTTLPRLFAAAMFLGAPYQMTLTFQDGSVELCGVDSFTIDGTQLAVQATTCEPDRIFSSGFEP